MEEIKGLTPLEIHAAIQERKKLTQDQRKALLFAYDKLAGIAADMERSIEIGELALDHYAAADVAQQYIDDIHSAIGYLDYIRYTDDEEYLRQSL